MSNVRFELVQNSLTVRATSYTDLDRDHMVDRNEGATVNEIRAGQNGDIGQGWTSLVKFGVVDTADGLGHGGRADRWTTYTDRFFVDQGEGIGIRDGSDERTNSADRKRFDGDERMFVGLGNDRDVILDGKLVLDRVASTDGSGAKVTLFAYDTQSDGTQKIVAEKTFDLTVVNGRAVVDFSAADFGFKVFDGIQIAAGDADSRFTFRSVDFEKDELDGLSLGGTIDPTAVNIARNGLTYTVTVLDGTTVVGTPEVMTARQNGVLQDASNVVTISAVDSPDGGNDRFTNAVDRTWADAGEGLGIMDGADERANSQLRKRIDGDETLMIALDEGFATTGTLRFERIENTGAGDDVMVRLYNEGLLVFQQGYDLDGADKTPDFGGVIFDTIGVSAIGNTAFSFHGASFTDLL